MTRFSFRALSLAALFGLGAATLAPAAAEAGHRGLGAGLLGLGIGVAIGSALAAPYAPPPPVYVAPPPPPVVYEPVAYGPRPWTPEWYSYCSARYGSFDPDSGYFIGYDGGEYFCR
jgi:hypothetical protein